MNSKLESLMERARAWPAEAQDEAVIALSDIEEKHLSGQRRLTPEEEAKVAALRETINRSIERGGSFTEEEIEASVASRLDAWERARKDV
jgi:hypothetical protein